MDRPDILHMLETGEGDRFPPIIKGSKQEDWGDGDSVYPFDETLQGKGWSLAGSAWGHIVVRCGWGVKIWLVGEGLLITSPIVPMALLVRGGETRRLTPFMAVTVLNAYCLSIWLPPLDLQSPLEGSLSCRAVRRPPSEAAEQAALSEAGASGGDRSDLDAGAEAGGGGRSSRERGGDAALGLVSWMPAAAPRHQVHEPAHVVMPPMVIGSNDVSFIPMDAVSRPVIQSAPPKGRDLSQIEASLETLRGLAGGGVISQEQYEACKNNARARDWTSLKKNLSSFQETPSIEKELRAKQVLLPLRPPVEPDLSRQGASSLSLLSLLSSHTRSHASLRPKGQCLFAST